TIGASSGTRDVRIVGINTYDDLRVSVEKINTRDIPVKITDVDSSAELKVIINGTKYNDPIPVKIKE
ncbi:MAG: hypothetical protein GY757_44460, partial [bacterium]|nr:hypothetical protein [bacterium]